MHERYNPKMRWETTKRKGSNSSADGKLGDLSGRNHDMEKEKDEIYLKREITLEATEMDSVAKSSVLPSDNYKNKMVAAAEKNENEVTITVNNIPVEENAKESVKRQDKQKDHSDGINEIPIKHSTKLNIPSVSISDVEIELEKLEISSSKTESIEGELTKLVISQPGDSEGKLSERSPVGNERSHKNNYNPYTFMSKVRYSGGGIVAEAPTAPDVFYTQYYPTSVHHNITDSSECNIYYPLPELSCLQEPYSPPPSPELPFVQESSSPPPTPLPEVEQVDLDAWLNDVNKEDEEIPEKLEDADQRAIPDYLDLLNVALDFNNCNTPCPKYRQAESIQSISSPSSGSRYSSECSPLSSPAPPSPGNSVASNSDTENKVRMSELILQESNATQSNSSYHYAQVANGSSQNRFLPLTPISSPPDHYYPVISEQTISLQPTQPVSLHSAPQQVQLPTSKSIQSIFIQNNAQTLTHKVQLRPNIQRGPVVPNIVTVSARDRIVSKLNKGVKDDATLMMAKLRDEDLSKGDENGDTQLMILLFKNYVHKLEYIFALINRIKHISGVLEARNAQNQSALRLASLFMPRMPIVARFIAEVMRDKDIPVNEEYEDGQTLLHLLCAVGDSHVEVLAELLSMKDVNNCLCFDVNHLNHRGETPLHVAARTHSRRKDCSRTVAFLLSQGANVHARELASSQTSLHMAIGESCDPLLVKILLQAAERRNIYLVNEADCLGNTALHYAALRNDVELMQQVRVIQLLMMYGAVSNRCGSQGKTPLALVSAGRKNEIQKVIHKR